MQEELEKEARALHTSNLLSLTLGKVKELLPYLVIVTKKPLQGNNNRIIIGLMFRDDNEKDSMTQQMSLFLGPLKEYIKLMVFSTEMWFAKYDKKQMKDLDNEPRPSQHPDRKEGVLTTAFTPNLKEIFTISQEMTRVKERITFEEEQVFKNENTGFHILERMMGSYGN